MPKHALGRDVLSRHVMALGRRTVSRKALDRGTLSRPVMALGRGIVSKSGTEPRHRVLACTRQRNLT